MKILFALFLSLTILAASKCSGARTDLTFEQLKFPVSLSNTFDSNQKLNITKSFKIEKKLWGIFYTRILITDEIDISDELNNLIISNNGNGVINLTINTNLCEINYFLPFTLLPFWPGCSIVIITGDIISFN